MGWGDPVVTAAHPVLEGIATGDRAHVVHPCQKRLEDPAQLLVRADADGPVTAVLGRDRMIVTQVHP